MVAAFRNKYYEKAQWEFLFLENKSFYKLNRVVIYSAYRYRNTPFRVNGFVEASVSYVVVEIKNGALKIEIQIA